MSKSTKAWSKKGFLILTLAVIMAACFMLTALAKTEQATPVFQKIDNMDSNGKSGMIPVYLPAGDYRVWAPGAYIAFYYGPLSNPESGYQEIFVNTDLPSYCYIQLTGTANQNYLLEVWEDEGDNGGNWIEYGDYYNAYYENNELVQIEVYGSASDPFYFEYKFKMNTEGFLPIQIYSGLQAGWETWVYGDGLWIEVDAPYDSNVYADDDEVGPIYPYFYCIEIAVEGISGYEYTVIVTQIEP